MRRLSGAGYEVKVANSRGPNSIEAQLLVSGARAVTAAEAVKDVDALIMSIPFVRVGEIAELLGSLSDDTVVIDTSNYYPLRDGRIDAVEAGQIESIWVSERIGRPIAKAWNAIGSDSFAQRGRPPGSPGRIAIPVAADSERDRNVAMALVEDSGLDAVDAGTLAESWRQQPGAPAYCTDLTSEEMPAALAAADRARLPARRDLAIQAVQERFGSATTNPKADYLVRLNRALYI